ncbi:MAG TPA: cyclase family protein [Paenalcaligenes sp.]|nr:cyclase family protein [Paenalcaligenes sp.]
MESPRWTQRPKGSTWGDFGAEDQIGRLNLLTAQRRLAALAEVRTGESFCLSLPLDYPGGTLLNENRHPPILRPCLRHGEVNMNYEMHQRNPLSVDVLSDDLAILHLQYSTQWDGLSHVGALFDVYGDGEPVAVYYNGFRAGEHVQAPQRVADCGSDTRGNMQSTCGAQALGIERMAETAVQGRGVLIDLHHHLGNQRTVVDMRLLREIMAADGVSVHTGDMLCLHTGFSQLLLDMKKDPDPQILHNSCAVLDGNDSELQDWITQSGVAVIAADNYAVEDFPADLPNPCCSILPLHHHCLFKLGVHLGELWYLTPLAKQLRAQGRNRFLLTAPPLRLPGAVGSPVTPVATL